MWRLNPGTMLTYRNPLNGLPLVMLRWKWVEELTRPGRDAMPKAILYSKQAKWCQGELALRPFLRSKGIADAHIMDLETLRATALWLAAQDIREEPEEYL